MTEGIESRVFKLAELVTYQDGAIVSRQVTKGNGGSVTAFAFDAGQGLSEHTTPHEALLQVIDGSARVQIAAATHRVSCGEAIRLPSDVPHAVYADERFKMLLVMIRSA